MEVKNKLSTAPLHVEYQFVPGFGDRLFSCDLLGPHDQFRDDLFVLFSEVVDTANVAPRNDEHVHGRRMVNVPKGHHRFIFIDDISRFSAADNPTERTMLVHPVALRAPQPLFKEI
jgi:hypothetical protein